MDLARTIGHNLRLAREDAGLSQGKLASMLGLSSHSAISEMESARRRISATELSRLSEILGKTVDWFLDPQAAREDFVSRARAQGEPEDVKKALREAERFYANFVFLESLLKRKAGQRSA